MQITKTDTFAGLPALTARKLMQEVRRRDNDGWDLASYAWQLDLDEPDALAIVAALTAEGFLEPAEPDRGEPMWRTTLRGNALALASAAPPVTRKTADKAVAGLLERAEAVNADPQYLYFVRAIVVFGSYLTDVERLGDVDVAIDYVRRIPAGLEHDAFMALVEERAGDRNIQDYVQYLCYMEIEVRRIMKNRSRVLSLHSIGDRILQQVETKTIFECTKPAIRPEWEGRPMEHLQ